MLDQCKRIASKFSKLESKRDVVTDLVIGHDLAIAQNQHTLTVDWFVYKMSTPLSRWIE